MSGQEHDIQKLPVILEQIINNTPGYLVDFSEKKYRPSDLKITSRTINSWNDQGLIPGTTKKGWHKFNLTECVWLKIITHLRNFNLQLSTIRQIKNQLFSQVEIPNIIKHNDVFKKIETALEKNNLIELNKIFQSQEYKDSLSEQEMNLLSCLVMDLIFTKSNMRLLFNTKGDIMIHKDNYEEYLNTLEDYRNFMRSSHISISLNQIFFEITDDLIEEIDFGKLRILTDEENKLLEVVREKGVVKIEILFDNEELAKMIKVTTKNKVDSNKRLREIIMKGGYQDIKITTQNGIVVNCENTRKIKF